MYVRYASFNRYGDISKFITDLDLLQVTWDKCVYISNENDYDIAVDLENCYGSFDEVRSFIAFLATQICELDNVAQRFHQKKRIKNDGRGYVCLPSPPGMYRIDYSQSMEDNPAPQKIHSLRLFLNIRRINFSCGLTARLTISPTTERTNSLS